MWPYEKDKERGGPVRAAGVKEGGREVCFDSGRVLDECSRSSESASRLIDDGPGEAV